MTTVQIVDTLMDMRWCTIEALYGETAEEIEAASSREAGQILECHAEEMGLPSNGVDYAEVALLIKNRLLRQLDSGG
ncbi:hypothetical protein [Cobetia marina]|uniref:hypothetical protein n=1 Tax=Cobetia marina TaxID=28258 RepID=UPI003A931B06